MKQGDARTEEGKEGRLREGAKLGRRGGVSKGGPNKRLEP